MTKEDVFKFLNTATPEVYAEIRAHMVKIRQDREFAKYLEKNEARRSRIEKIWFYHSQGKSNKEIGEIFNLSSARIAQLIKQHKFYL